LRKFLLVVFCLKVCPKYWGSFIRRQWSKQAFDDSIRVLSMDRFFIIPSQML
jgi:hypothetical protein